MELKYGNVKLRAIEKEDCQLLKLLMNSAVIEKSILGWNLPISTIMQEKWIDEYKNSNSTMRWIIELSNNITLGMVTLRNVDWKNREAELELKTNPYEKQRLYGDTKNTLYAVIRYSFEELGLHRLNSLILISNKFSRKLNEELGFKLEGIQREKIFKNNVWNDMCCYALLKQDYVYYEDGQAPWQVKKSKNIVN